MRECAERLNEEKEKATEVIQWLCKVEARAGVEPTYTDLQRIVGLNILYKSTTYRSYSFRAKFCVTNINS